MYILMEWVNNTGCLTKELVHITDLWITISDYMSVLPFVHMLCHNSVLYCAYRSRDLTNAVMGEAKQRYAYPFILSKHDVQILQYFFIYSLFWIPATALSQLQSSIFQIDQSHRLVKIDNWNNTAINISLWVMTLDAYIIFIELFQI